LHINIVSSDQNLLDSVSERDRRAIAIRFLRGDEVMGALLKRCAGDTPEAQAAKVEMACVLLMAKNDAPEDLQMTDAALYRRLRDRITDIRMGGWLR
jgi:hypothetical protein